MVKYNRVYCENCVYFKYTFGGSYYYINYNGKINNYYLQNTCTLVNKFYSTPNKKLKIVYDFNTKNQYNDCKNFKKKNLWHKLVAFFF